MSSSACSKNLQETFPPSSDARTLNYGSFLQPREAPSTVGPGSVGVELKCADLTFRRLIEGAIHRGIVWVLGNPQEAEMPEAVALYVVKPGSTPVVDSALSASLCQVLAWLKEIGVHVVFINGETGASWKAPNGVGQARLPSWLASEAFSELKPLDPPSTRLVDQLESLDPRNGHPVYLFDSRLECYEYDVGSEGKILYAKWPVNHWQIIDAGLLIRGADYDAVKICYSGDERLTSAGRRVERNIGTQLARRFGVVLDWGVPLGD